jgi:pentose-5-phosphate-3-epimerase
MANFTFKTNKPTGRYKAFYNISIDIKYEKAIVGSIDHDAPYKIRLMVEKTDTITDNNPNCSWKWITLKYEFESIDASKEWLQTNKDSILRSFTLHKLEE